jgi:hypothetical protein
MADEIFHVKPSPEIDSIMAEFGYLPNVMRTGWVNPNRHHDVIDKPDLGGLISNPSSAKLREFLRNWIEVTRWKIPDEQTRN